MSLDELKDKICKKAFNVTYLEIKNMLKKIDMN